jgi:hypothetical protein
MGGRRGSRPAPTARHAGTTARRAANRGLLRFLAPVGLLARGLLYIVVGWIALQIAFGKSGQQADRSGAMQALGRTPVGAVALWALVIGFFAMALWQLSEAIFGPPSAGRKVTTRLRALARAVVYGILGYAVFKYAIGEGGQQSSDKQSVDLTATLLRHPGGQAAVVVIGLAFIGGGLYLGYQAWRERFREGLRLNETRAATGLIVGWLGRVGGLVRGLVFVTVGVFLVVAAVTTQPQQAKGLDSALRSLAATPGGPWLLALVAIGLIIFGAFSCCEARWARVDKPASTM